MLTRLTFWGGIYITAVNSYLSPDEVAYILDDCDATVVFSSRAKADVAASLDPATTPNVERWLMVDGLPAGEAGPDWEPYEEVIAAHPTSRLAAPPEPLNSATIAGMAVMATMRAENAPIRLPRTMPTAIQR